MKIIILMMFLLISSSALPILFGESSGKPDSELGYIPMSTSQAEEKAALVQKLNTTSAPTSAVHGIKMSENAVATEDGGFVTIPHPTDENGRKITIHYEVGKRGSGGKIVPACRGPDQGLYQEGNNWIFVNDPSSVGIAEKWVFPTGTLSGMSEGIFYNPVNFWYPAPQGLYDFFQVDYGLGNNLSPRRDWIMTYSYVDNNGERQYPFTSMSAVPISPGSTYRVDATLQDGSLSNPPAYVVQVTLGSDGWIYREPLRYVPILGKAYNFQTYQDQYLLSQGTIALSPDTNSDAQVLTQVSGSISSNPDLITGMTSFDNPNTHFLDKTYDGLSPSPLNMKPFNDMVDCPKLPGGGDCLIATAAFSSELAPQVQFLRNFRDNHIMSTLSGSSFMNVFNAWYYSFSPFVAEYEREHPWFQQTVKASIYPLLGILLVAERTFSLIPGEYGAISSGLISLSLMGAVYVSPIVLAIRQVRNGRFNYKLAFAVLAITLLAVVFSILSSNQISVITTALLFLLTILAISAILSAKIVSWLAKRIVHHFNSKV